MATGKTRGRQSASAIGVFGVLAAILLLGCGGGGGGAGKNGGLGVPFGRSYHFSSGSQVFTLSVDNAGRYTVFAKDNAALAAGSGGQGSLAADGKFFTQSSDSAVQYSGSVASDGNSASGSVQRNGTAVFSFNAALVAPGAATDPISGTYSVASGGSLAYLTVDLTGHGALFAITNAVTGGGLINITPAGVISSTDGSIAGQLTQAGAVFTLQLSRLNGAAVSFNSSVNKSTRAKWTFMVFLNAANNLQPFSGPNVNQMEQIGSNADISMVVQWKQAACAGCGSPAWVGTRRYFITRDNDTANINSQLVQDLGNSVDMGKWQELRNFVTWAQANYPADHYALVMWDHGAGWRQTRGTDRRKTAVPRAVSTDDQFNTEIETWELPQALAVTPKLDMIIFDASLMQMVEVAYELRNSASVMVGSEESPPGEGYVYNTFLGDLQGNPALTAADFGRKIVTRTLEAYGHNNNLTQSALDLSRMENLASKIDVFGTRLQQHVADSRNAMVDARQTAQSYAYPENKDLWDYGDILAAGTTASDLKQAVSDVQGAITATLLAEDHGTINGKSHGIAIYVPAPIDYLTNYTNLEFGRKFSWSRWLQAQPSTKQ